jgi:hypothetical protein
LLRVDEGGGSQERPAAGARPARPESARSPGLRESQRDEIPNGLARLYLNLGRKDGAQESEIRTLLREHAGVSEVAEIDIMNTHTYLNVAATDADRICASLTGRQLGDRDLVCERARPRR